MGFVFVSHSSRDKHIVEKICKYLEGNGIDFWVDKEDIPAAKDFRGAIMRAIESEDCKALLLMLSFGSASSKDVDTEIAIARDADKPIIVYKIHKIDIDRRLGVLSYDIRRSQVIDASSDPLDDRKLGELVKTLSEDQKIHIDIETAYKNKLKDFQINEEYNRNNYSFYFEWGETVRDYCELFDPDNIVLLQQARNKFEKSIELNKSVAEIQVNMAKLLSAIGSLSRESNYFEEAKRYFNMAFSLNDKDCIMYWEYAKSVIMWAKIDPEQRNMLYEEIDQGFEEATRLDPNNYALYLEWANHLFERSSSGSGFVERYCSMACEKYQKAYLFNPKMEGILNQWNSVLTFWGRSKGLENSGDSWYFDTANNFNGEADKELPDLQYKLANAILCYSISKFRSKAFEIGQELQSEIDKMLNSSISKYKFILQQNFNEAQVFNNLGIALIYLGKLTRDENIFKEAQYCFEKAGTRGNCHPGQYYNMGLAFMESANFLEAGRDEMLKKAVDNLKMAIDRDWPSPDAYNNMGLALLKLSEGKAPAESYKLALDAVDCFRMAGEMHQDAF